MAQSTYQFLSEFIINAHYDGFPTPEQPITQRFVAQRIAQKVATAAVKNAYQSSNLAEATYSNDQFIAVFNSCPLLTDSVTNNKYVVMPATPAGLPNGREIAQVSFTGYPNVWCVQMQNRSDFVESGLPPLPSDIQLFKVESGNIVFRNLPSIINSPVNLKLVGAVMTDNTLLTSYLNVPKNVEDEIVAEILNELAMEYKVAPQNLEIGEPTT